jgi:hypothetical protein
MWERISTNGWGAVPNGATYRPYPWLRLSRDDFRPLDTRGSKQVWLDMKNALAPMRKTAMVGIVQCALRYF